MGVRVVERWLERQAGNPMYGPPEKIRHRAQDNFFFGICIDVVCFCLFM